MSQELIRSSKTFQMNLKARYTQKLTQLVYQVQDRIYIKIIANAKTQSFNLRNVVNSLLNEKIQL